MPTSPTTPPTPIQSSQDLVQKHVEISQRTNEDPPIPCLPSSALSHPSPNVIPPPLQDTLSSSHPDQDPILPSPLINDPILSPIQTSPSPSLYTIGSLTFIHGGPIATETLNSVSNICSSTNEETPPFSPSKKYPTLVQMLKKWNYQGKGLGQQEHDTIELVIVNAHP